MANRDQVGETASPQKLTSMFGGRDSCGIRLYSLFEGAASHREEQTWKKCGWPRWSHSKNDLKED